MKRKNDKILDNIYNTSQYKFEALPKISPDDNYVSCEDTFQKIENQKKEEIELKYFDCLETNPLPKKAKTIEILDIYYKIMEHCKEILKENFSEVYFLVFFCEYHNKNLFKIFSNLLEKSKDNIYTELRGFSFSKKDSDKITKLKEIDNNKLF